MTETLLIRHAHIAALGQLLAGRSPGHRLDAAGRREAGALGQALRTVPLAAIDTSPLERARETAAALAVPHGIEPITDEAFHEVDCGDWTGRDFQELAGRPAWHEYHRARGSTRIPGGELLLEVQARAVAGIERLLPQHADSSIAIVSHAEVIRCVLAACLGVPLQLALRLEIGTASVSRVHWQPGGPVVCTVNEPVPSPVHSSL